MGRRLNPEHGGTKDDLKEERPANRASPSRNVPMDSLEEKWSIWFESERKLTRMEGRRHKKCLYERKMFITRIARRLGDEFNRNRLSDMEMRDALNKTYRELPGLDFDDEEDPDKMITVQFVQMLEEGEIKTDIRVSEWDF